MSGMWESIKAQANDVAESAQGQWDRTTKQAKEEGWFDTRNWSVGGKTKPGTVYVDPADVGPDGRIYVDPDAVAQAQTEAAPVGVPTPARAPSVPVVSAETQTSSAPVATGVQTSAPEMVTSGTQTD